MPMQISGVTIQGGMNILPRAGAPSPTPGPAPGPSDPNFSNVVFMLDGDGTDGEANNTFTDSSTNAHTITKNGDVTQGSFSPYGDNWSNDFSGATDRLSWTNPSASYPPQLSFLNDTTSDGTIEAWINPRSLVNYNVSYAYAMPAIIAVGDTYFAFLVTNTGALSFYWWTGGPNFITTTTGTVEIGVWNHVAVTKSGNQIKLYINGVLGGSGTYATWSWGTSSGGQTLQVGWHKPSNVNCPFDGHISNLRVVNGSVVYTGNFTPPSETLTAITNTSFLTCQSNRFEDNSTNNYALVITGTPKVTPFSPFKDDDARDITTDGGSGYFDTSGDTLTVPYSSTLAMGTGDCTIEAWVYFESYPQAFSNILDTRDSGFGSDAISFSVENDGTFSFYAGSYSSTTHVLETASGTVTLNSWYHLVVTRVSGTTKLYVNGVEEASSTNAWNQTSGSSTNLYIAGAAGVTRQVNGYISNLRLVKGTAVYTTNFTPPTSPLTAITNTSLLLNFQDSAIYDYSGLNNIDTVGNAQIDTAVKKYGTGSVKFDGTGDCLEISDTTFNSTLAPTGTEDFTIEAWININAHKNYNYIYSQGYPIQWVVTSTGVIQTHFNDTDDSTTYFTCHQTSGSALSTGTWYHVAITRDGASFRLFLDGVQVGSASVASSIAVTSLNPRIGDWALGGYSMNGYIDDFRITKGVARYTSNFTAPTAALPKF